MATYHTRLLCKDLKEVFAEYGAVESVVIPTDRETGKARGFAFVQMFDSAEEDAAISALDGAEWLRRSLRVNKAKPKTNNREVRCGGRGRY